MPSFKPDTATTTTTTASFPSSFASFTDYDYFYSDCKTKPTEEEKNKQTPLKLKHPAHPVRRTKNKLFNPSQAIERINLVPPLSLRFHQWRSSTEKTNVTKDHYRRQICLRYYQCQCEATPPHSGFVRDFYWVNYATTGRPLANHCFSPFFIGNFFHGFGGKGVQRPSPFLLPVPSQKTPIVCIGAHTFLRYHHKRTSFEAAHTPARSPSSSAQTPSTGSSCWRTISNRFTGRRRT